MVETPAKGERADVHITDQAQGRIQIGISWDVQEKTIETGFLFFKKKKQITETYDLDISCFIYDDENELLDMVTPEGAHMMDESEQINHSGDNTTGRTRGDDEFISVTVPKLPENIQNIIFLVTSADERPFKEIGQAEARVSDGQSDAEQLRVKLAAGNGANAQACAFVGLHRDQSRESGWALSHIAEFFDSNELEWSKELARFI